MKGDFHMKHIKNMEPSKRRLVCVALAACAAACCIAGIVIRRRNETRYF